MDINKEEVLRYLGYNNQVLDEKLSTQIDIGIKELKSIGREKFTYHVFEIEMKDYNIKLLNSNLKFRGKDIYNHLKDSSRCAVIAVTLGVQVDKKIMGYSKIDLMKSLIIDACASAAIEAICDNIELEISKIAKIQGFNITSRYSPGYGDFHLDIQPDILNSIDAYKKIGLSTTENFILLPRKSVTAVIGFHKEKAIQKKIKCIECKNENCNFRRGECYFE